MDTICRGCKNTINLPAGERYCIDCQDRNIMLDIPGVVGGYMAVFGKDEATRIISAATPNWVWSRGRAEAYQYALDLLAAA